MTSTSNAPEIGQNVPPAAMAISVVVPTLNRHAALQRALASLTAQAVPCHIRFEVLVVDNSLDGNARDIVQAIADHAAQPIHYIAMPRPGVATARNAGVAAASGDWIAFLDDDEQAAPVWLAKLAEVAQSQEVDAVFGPIDARPDGNGLIAPFESYFCRRLDLPTGTDVTHLAAYFGTNNSMFSARAFAGSKAPFQASLDQWGGEDSLFLRTLVLAGRRFAWAAEAHVIEWVPPKRLSWTYVGRRKFLSGQIRTFVHSMLTPAEKPWILLWMLVGLVQFTLAGAGAVLAYAFDRGASRRLQVVSLGGLGKFLWTKHFRPNLYGRGLVS